MSLLCNVGSFAKSTGGAPASQSVTGVSFTPKVLIFFFDGSTTVNTWGSQDITQGFGIAESDNSSEYAVATAVEDLGAGNSNAASGKSNVKCILIINPDQTTIAEADLSSYDADGFTLNWTTNDGNATIINYMALGGTEITNSNVVSDIAFAAGDHAVIGAGFQPDCLLHIFNTRLNTTEAGNIGHGAIGMGACNAVGADAAFQVFTADNDVNKQNKSRSSISSCIYGVETIVAGEDVAAALKSFDADGFTLDVTNNSPSPGYRHFTLCLKGVTTKVGTYNKPATTTGTDSETGAGFQPVGALFFSNSIPSDTAGANLANVVVGASDGTNDRSSTAQVDLGSTAPQIYSSNAAVWVMDDYQSYTPDTTKSEANLDSFDADGFTLDWTANDIWQSRIHYLLFDQVTAPASYTPGAGDGADAEMEIMDPAVQYPTPDAIGY